jgi:peptide deformylase
MLKLVDRKHPALHRKARAITEEEAPSFLPLAKDMVGYCRSGANRLALAAPQVGRSVALVATKTGDMIANPICTVDKNDRIITQVEGCLSLPRRGFAVERFVRCQVSGFLVDGWVPVNFEAHGLEARIWQHECDHLSGFLISDFWPEVGL